MSGVAAAQIPERNPRADGPGPDPAIAARRRRRRQAIALRILILVVVLGSWQLTSPLLGTVTSSSPSDIAQTIGSWGASSYLWTNLEATVLEVVLGYVAGSIAGIIFGVAFATFRVLGDAVDPFIVGLYGVPKIAFGPLLVVWLGIGLTPKVALAGIMVFFLVFFSTYQGIRNVDERQINSVRLMGASSWQVRRYVILPGARANVFLGLKLGIPEALVGAVVGEFISSSKGLGYTIQYATAQFDTTGVFAGIIVLGAVAIALNYIVGKAAQSSPADHPTL